MDHPLLPAADRRRQRPVLQATLAEVGPGRFFVGTTLGHLYIGDLPTGARIEASNRDLALHVSGWGPGTEAGLSIGGADGVQIYNNTLYGNSDTRPGELYGAEWVVFDLRRPGCPQVGCVERWRTRNVVIRNNLTGGSGSRRLFNSSTGVADLAARVPADTFITAMDHNGYHRSAAAGGPPTPATFAGWLHPRPAAEGGPFHVDHASLASVQAFTAAEDHGLAFEQVADPFFVDAAAGDFSLLANSPARASGDPLPAAVAAAIGVPAAPAPVNRGALAWPTLQLRVPAYGSTVGGPAVALATNVPDPARVTRVEYHVNRVGSMTTTKVGSTVNRGFGYAVVWNTTAVADGPYELRAHALSCFATRALRTWSR